MWMEVAVGAALGMGGLLYMLLHARTRVRRLEGRQPVRARVVEERLTRSAVALRLAYARRRAPVEAELVLDREVAGLGWGAERGAWAPVPWRLLFTRVMPLLAMAVAGAYGLVASRLLTPL